MEKKKSQEKMLKRSSLIIIAATFFLLIIVMVAVIYRYYNLTDEKLFEERKLHLIEFTDKVAGIIDETVNSAWKELDAGRHMIVNEGQDLEDKEDLVELLLTTGDFIHSDVSMLLVFDEKGTYYASDGHMGYWEDNSVFDAAESKRRNSVVRIPHISSGSFLFFTEPITGIQMKEDGRKLTYIAIAINSDSVRKSLSISGFGDECYSYISELPIKIILNLKIHLKKPANSRNIIDFAGYI